MWVADEKAGFDDWRSIGDTLPTQAVGGIDFSPADGGTVIVSTGDNVFGGGGTFAGLGVFRTTDGGAQLAARERRAGRGHHLQGRGRPDEPAGRLRGHRRGPLPLHRRRRARSPTSTCRRAGRRPGPAELHRRRARQGGLRAREHGHGRRRPGPAQRQDRRRRAGLGRRRRRLARRQQAEPAVQELPGRLRRGAQQRHLPLRRPARRARSRRSTRASPGLPERAANGFAEQKRIGRVELGEADRRRPGPQLPLRDRRGRRALPRRHRRDRHPRGGDRPGARQHRAQRHLRLARLRQDVDAHGRRRAAQGPVQRLGADRHGLRDALLPGRPGLVQPPDRAGPDARRRPPACRRGWSSASRRSGRTRSTAR